MNGLLDYDSDSDQEQQQQQNDTNQNQSGQVVNSNGHGSQNGSNQTQNQNNQNQEKNEKKFEEPQKPVKRKINLSELKGMKPFKQIKLNAEEFKTKESNEEDKKQIQAEIERNKQALKEKNKNLGIKTFSLSKPKNQLKNIGYQEMQKQKLQNQQNNGNQLFSYDDLVSQKVQQEKELRAIPNFGILDQNKENSVKNKISTYLNKDLTEDQIQKIKEFDDDDQMFIDQKLKHRYDQNLIEQQFQEQNLTEEEYYQRMEQQKQEEEELQNLINQNANKNQKKNQGSIEVLDVNRKDLLLEDWAGFQEKTATSKELMSKNKIQMPVAKEAKSKNKIQFLAQQVQSTDQANLGLGSQRKSINSKSRYGW